MLFRTVYGPELEAIYNYIVKCNIQNVNPSKTEICTMLMLPQTEGKSVSEQSVEDALAFLKSAHLITEEMGYVAYDHTPSVPFAIRVLPWLRRLEQGAVPTDHPLDPLYTCLLTELFIKPDQLFVADVHTSANRLPAVQSVGGLSQEKIRAWERVMTFLGIGQRIADGFQCVYAPTLMSMILEQWKERRGTLQSFLEDCLAWMLPYANTNGDLAQAALIPLSYLHTRGQIELFPLQDSPTRAYFGQKRYKGIAWGGNYA